MAVTDAAKDPAFSKNLSPCLLHARLPERPYTSITPYTGTEVLP
jgi:hypothetical protein